MHLCMSIYNANMYEHLQKMAYRARNKIQFLEFIVKYNRRLEAFRRSREGWIFSSNWKKYNIGYGMLVLTPFKIQCYCIEYIKIIFIFMFNIDFEQSLKFI